MGSLLISGVGLGMIVSGIVIWVKEKQRKEEENIKVMEEHEKEKLIRDLQKSWSSFEKNKIRPSIRAQNDIFWTPEDEKAQEAWNKIHGEKSYTSS